MIRKLRNWSCSRLDSQFGSNPRFAFQSQEGRGRYRPQGARQASPEPLEQPNAHAFARLEGHLARRPLFR